MAIDQLSINTIRFLSAEAVQSANSGHPGLPLGAAPMAYTLWAKVMKHNSKDPKWFNRDRFILSAGHGSAMLYSLLYLFDYGLTMDDLMNFRQLDSKTPGHPEYKHTIGVEATTGPLGQGISNAVGMALAEAHLASTFNKEDHELIDHYTYVLCGDGDLMEGISNEASSLAGTLGLGKLIVLYDSNSITIEGSTDLAFNEKVRGRYEALGWETFLVEDGNNISEIEKAVNSAKANLDKPSLIEIRTEIGYGSPKVGLASAHGEPLGEDNIVTMREYFQWESQDYFHIPEQVTEHMKSLVEKGGEHQKEWEELYSSYEEKYPELAAKFKSYVDMEIPMDYLDSDEFWTFEKPGMASRESSGVILNRLAEKIPNLIGGSADLAPSNKTYLKDRKAIKKDEYDGHNIHFGVREHAMAAALNGMALHGGLRPFGGTFFIFTDYMKPSMRLSSLMELPVTYVLTHDSIGVGEDGPTHQPIEQLAVFRAQPNFIDFRPADSRETAAGWYTALTNENTPTGLILTRQGLPDLEGTGKGALKGGYILKKESGNLDIILMGTGSEVQLAVEAAKELEEKGYGVRVVSMPSWKLFEDQSDEYKEEVLPKAVSKRVSIEAASSLGWHKYVGSEGRVISIDTFGGSAPGKQLYEKFNITTEKVLEEALDLLKK